MSDAPSVQAEDPVAEETPVPGELPDDLGAERAEDAFRTLLVGQAGNFLSLCVEHLGSGQLPPVRVLRLARNFADRSMKMLADLGEPEEAENELDDDGEDTYGPMRATARRVRQGRRALRMAALADEGGPAYALPGLDGVAHQALRTQTRTMVAQRVNADLAALNEARQAGLGSEVQDRLLSDAREALDQLQPPVEAAEPPAPDDEPSLVAALVPNL